MLEDHAARWLREETEIEDGTMTALWRALASFAEWARRNRIPITGEAFSVAEAMREAGALFDREVPGPHWAAARLEGRRLRRLEDRHRPAPIDGDQQQAIDLVAAMLAESVKRDINPLLLASAAIPILIRLVADIGGHARAVDLSHAILDDLFIMGTEFAKSPKELN